MVIEEITISISIAISISKAKSKLYFNWTIK
jgi:hypothetical protein